MATDAKTMLENVRAAIDKLIVSGGAVQSFSINGRETRFYSMSELLNLEKTLERRASRESESTRVARNVARFRGPS